MSESRKQTPLRKPPYVGGGKLSSDELMATLKSLHDILERVKPLEEYTPPVQRRDTLDQLSLSPATSGMSRLEQAAVYGGTASAVGPDGKLREYEFPMSEPVRSAIATPAAIVPGMGPVPVLSLEEAALRRLPMETEGARRAVSANLLKDVAWARPEIPQTFPLPNLEEATPVEGRGSEYTDAFVAVGRGLSSVASTAMAVPEILDGIANVIQHETPAGSVGAFAPRLLGRITKYVRNTARAIGGDPEEWQAALSYYYSPEALRQLEQLQGAVTTEETLRAIAANPKGLLLSAAETVPQTVSAAGIGRAIPFLSPIAKAALGEGILTSLTMLAEKVNRGMPLTMEDYQIALSSGALTSLIGRTSARMANKWGITDIDTFLTGVRQNPELARSIVKAATLTLASGGTEMMEEFLQSGQERVAQNLMQGRPWHEGVGSEATLGGAIGGVLGTASGVAELTQAVSDLRRTDPEWTRRQSELVADIIKGEWLRGGEILTDAVVAGHRALADSLDPDKAGPYESMTRMAKAKEAEAEEGEAEASLPPWPVTLGEPPEAERAVRTGEGFLDWLARIYQRTPSQMLTISPAVLSHMDKIYRAMTAEQAAPSPEPKAAEAPATPGMLPMSTVVEPTSPVMTEMQWPGEAGRAFLSDPVVQPHEGFTEWLNRIYGITANVAEEMDDESLQRLYRNYLSLGGTHEAHLDDIGEQLTEFITRHQDVAKESTQALAMMDQVLSGFLASARKAKMSPKAATETHLARVSQYLRNVREELRRRSGVSAEEDQQPERETVRQAIEGWEDRLGTPPPDDRLLAVLPQERFEEWVRRVLNLDEAGYATFKRDHEAVTYLRGVYERIAPPSAKQANTKPATRAAVPVPKGPEAELRAATARWQRLSWLKQSGQRLSAAEEREWRTLPQAIAQLKDDLAYRQRALSSKEYQQRSAARWAVQNVTWLRQLRSMLREQPAEQGVGPEVWAAGTVVQVPLKGQMRQTTVVEDYGTDVGVVSVAPVPGAPSPWVVPRRLVVPVDTTAALPWEEQDATQKGDKSEGDQREHQGAEGTRVPAEAGGGDRAPGVEGEQAGTQQAQQQEGVLKAKPKRKPVKKGQAAPQEATPSQTAGTPTEATTQAPKPTKPLSEMTDEDIEQMAAEIAKQIEQEEQEAAVKASAAKQSLQDVVIAQLVALAGEKGSAEVLQRVGEAVASLLEGMTVEVIRDTSAWETLKAVIEELPSKVPSDKDVTRLAKRIATVLRGKPVVREGPPPVVAKKKARPSPAPTQTSSKEAWPKTAPVETLLNRPTRPIAQELASQGWLREVLMTREDGTVRWVPVPGRVVLGLPNAGQLTWVVYQTPDNLYEVVEDKTSVRVGTASKTPEEAIRSAAKDMEDAKSLARKLEAARHRGVPAKRYSVLTEQQKAVPSVSAKAMLEPPAEPAPTKPVRPPRIVKTLETLEKQAEKAAEGIEQTTRQLQEVAQITPETSEMAQDIKAASSRLSELDEEARKIWAEIEKAKQELLEALKNQLSSGVDPSLIVPAVKIVVQLAKLGINRAEAAWVQFKAIMGAHALDRRVRRAFELAWMRVHAGEVVSVDALDAAEQGGTSDVTQTERQRGAVPDAGTQRPSEPGGDATGAEGAGSTQVLGTVSSTDREGTEGEGAERTGKADQTEGVGTPLGDAEDAGRRGAVDREGRTDQGDDLSPAGAETEAPVVRTPPFVLTPELVEELKSMGPVQRLRANVEAIELLKRLSLEGRMATVDEQLVLAKYTGFGDEALAKLLPSETEGYHYWNRPSPDVVQLVDRLFQALTEEERKAILRAAPTSFYTYSIYNAIWEAVQQLGFSQGRVLEPAVGTGHAFATMPADMRNNSVLVGIEKEPIVAAIATHLFQNAKILAMPYEKVRLAHNMFDLVISNVPFGRYGVVDEELIGRDRWLTEPIHNYFFVKALMHVRPGGVVVFITSRFTMDSLKGKAFRSYLMQQAHFLGAVRLPNTAFKKTARTEVVTDVVVLQKRAPDDMSMTTEDLEFIETLEKEVGGRLRTGRNKYYETRPHAILGTEKYGRGMYGEEEYLVEPPSDADSTLEQQLAIRLKEVLPKKPVMGQSVDEATVAVEAALRRVEQADKEGSLIVLDNGSIGVVTRTGVEPIAIPKSHIQRVKGMIAVRDALRDVLDSALDPKQTEEELKKRQAALRKAYDEFVAKYGLLNEYRNAEAFAIDPEAKRLLALEVVEPRAKIESTKEGKQKLQAVWHLVRLADIFTMPKPRGVGQDVKVETAEEALVASLGRFAAVNWAYMSKVTGRQVDDLQRELAGMERVFEMPDGTWITREEFLSGDVVTKLEMFQVLSQLEPKRWSLHVERLKEVQPKPLPPERISIRLGAHWVPKEVFVKFLADFFQAEERSIKLELTGNETIHIWELKLPDVDHELDVASEIVSGRRYSAAKMIDDIFNHRLPEVTWSVDKEQIYDHQATLAARANIEVIKDRFQKWLQANPDIWEKTAEVYNKRFVRHVPRKYDGSHLQLPGMSRTVNGEPLELDAHQKNAIWRILTSGNTLLAHGVGFGKTYTMIAAAMEMRRLGRARKPMIVVPTHLLSSWRQAILQLYPHAKVLMFDEKDLAKSKRQAQMARIALQDWDIILVPHSSFGLLSVSPRGQMQVIQEWVDWLRGFLIMRELEDSELKYASEKKPKRPRSIKQIERQLLALERKLEELAVQDRARDDKTLYWEQLGVDALFVDEAHLFKNLYFFTNLENMRGLNRSMSQRAFDLYLKVRLLNRVTNERNVVLATATPIMNSLSDLYTMQRYLQQRMMRDLGIDHFDRWYDMFAEALPTSEQRPNGEYQEVIRLRAFRNLVTLRTLMDPVLDVVMELPKHVKLPKVKGGKPRVVEVQTPSIYPMLRDWFTKRLDIISMVRPSYDYEEGVFKAPARITITQDRFRARADLMITIMTDAKLAAVDPRLVAGPMALDPETDKQHRLAMVADEVVETLRATEANKGTVLLFLDVGTPKKPGKLPFLESVQEESSEVDESALKGLDDEAAFGEEGETDVPGDSVVVATQQQAQEAPVELYELLRKELIARGVPREQIAFIHEAKNNVERLALYEAMNNGRVRVMFASTDKGGVGMNVQKRLAKLIHVDAPMAMRPGDITQREGRIIRRGNMFEEVEISRYVTRGTADEWLYGLLSTKADMIAAFMRGEVDQYEDLDPSTLSLDEARALATGDDRVRRLVELRGKIARLEAQIGSQSQLSYQWKMTLNAERTRLRDAKESLDALRELQDRVADNVAAYAPDIRLLSYGTESQEMERVTDKEDINARIFNIAVTNGLERFDAVRLEPSRFGGRHISATVPLGEVDGFPLILKIALHSYQRIAVSIGLEIGQTRTIYAPDISATHKELYRITRPILEETLKDAKFYDLIIAALHEAVQFVPKLERMTEELESRVRSLEARTIDTSSMEKELRQYKQEQAAIEAEMVREAIEEKQERAHRADISIKDIPVLHISRGKIIGAQMPSGKSPEEVWATKEDVEAVPTEIDPVKTGGRTPPRSGAQDTEEETDALLAPSMASAPVEGQMPRGGTGGPPPTRVRSKVGHGGMGEGTDTGGGGAAPDQPQGPRPAQGGQQPLELPEAIEFIERLIGKVPTVVAAFRSAQKQGEAKLSPSGEMEVRVLASLFHSGDIAMAAMVLMHEIGHVVDWLPDAVSRRGNLLGHVLTLRRFMAEEVTHNGQVFKDRKLRNEARAVSMYWRPFDPERTSEHYRRYRMSAKELYADFVSMVLNDPGLAEQLAPNLTKLFFETLDRKATVKQAYDELQALIARGQRALVEHRRDRVRQMLEEGERRWAEVQQARHEQQKEATRLTLDRVLHQFVEASAPVERAITRAERARGITIDEQHNPLFALEERYHARAAVKTFLLRAITPLVMLMKDGVVDKTTVGEILLYQRILGGDTTWVEEEEFATFLKDVVANRVVMALGDRAFLANPKGLTPKHADQLLREVRRELGNERYERTLDAIDKMRDEFRRIMEEAFRSGLFKPDIWERLRDNLSYAPFRVVQYLEEPATAFLRTQIGTFKDIASPLTALVERAEKVLLATAHNRAKRLLGEFLQQYYPDQVQPAVLVWTGKYHKAKAPVRPDQGVLEWYDSGTYKALYVPKLFEEIARNDRMGATWAPIVALRVANNLWFRPVFTVLNLGFQSYMMWRDFFRTWKHQSLRDLVRGYRRAHRLARIRAFGLPYERPLMGRISEVLTGQPAERRELTPEERQAWEDMLAAEERAALPVTFSEYLALEQLSDDPLVNMFHRAGIVMQELPKSLVRRAIGQVLTVIRQIADYQETISKAAVMYEGRQGVRQRPVASLTPSQTHFLRTYVASPDYQAGGVWKPVTNEVFLFSHAIIFAWVADLKMATQRRTAAEWWWKTLLLNMMPKFLIAAAMAAALGAGDDDEEDESWLARLGRLYMRVRESDLTNTLPVVIGETAEGQPVYIRLPMDDTGRVISGLVWKVLRRILRDPNTRQTFVRDMMDVMGYVYGQFPTLQPLVGSLVGTATYLSGGNPYDWYRQEPLFTPEEMARGGDFVKFMRWQADQLGLAWLTVWVPEEREEYRGTAAVPPWTKLPVVGRWVRVGGREPESLWWAAVAAGIEESAERREVVRQAMLEFVRETRGQGRTPTTGELWARARRLVKTVAPPAVPGDEDAAVARMVARLRMAYMRSGPDTLTDAVLAATTVTTKARVLQVASQHMPRPQFEAWLRQARQTGVVTERTLAAYRYLQRQGASGVAREVGAH